MENQRKSNLLTAILIVVFLLLSVISAFTQEVYSINAYITADEGAEWVNMYGTVYENDDATTIHLENLSYKVVKYKETQGYLLDKNGNISTYWYGVIPGSDGVLQCKLGYTTHVSGYEFLEILIMSGNENGSLLIYNIDKNDK